MAGDRQVKVYDQFNSPFLKTGMCFERERLAKLYISIP